MHCRRRTAFSWTVRLASGMPTSRPWLRTLAVPVGSGRPKPLCQTGYGSPKANRWFSGVYSPSQRLALSQNGYGGDPPPPPRPPPRPSPPSPLQLVAVVV
eukprot:740080-Pyramimonas_sp.AAC.1